MQYQFDFPTPCSKCGAVVQQLEHVHYGATVPSAQLHSNYKPRLLETIESTRIVSSYNVAIQSLESEYFRIQNCLRNLYQLKASRLSLLSPLRRIPDDILGHIFSFVCEDTIDIGEKDDPVWALLHVCTRWRDVAETTPSLWNSFKLSTGFNDKNIYHYRRRMVACMANSGGSPLFVTITPPDPNVSQMNVHSLLDGESVLSPQQLSRCASLEVNCNWIGPSIAALEANQNLPNLKRLACYSRVLPIGFGADTALQELKQHSVSFYNAFPPYSLLNLRKLDITNCSMRGVDNHDISASIISVLARTPRLEELRWVSTKAGRSSNVIDLPLLRSLDFHDCGSLLSSIRAPSLTKMRFQWPSKDLIQINAIQNLVTRSGCVIKRLEINFMPPPNNWEITPFFHFFDTLEELSIYSQGIEAKEIRRILSDPNSTGGRQILPSLRRLEAEITDAHMARDVVSDIIQSKANLRYFRYFMDGQIDTKGQIMLDRFNARLEQKHGITVESGMTPTEFFD